MRTRLRDRLVEQIARSLLWSQAEGYKRDSARANARRIVDDLLDAHATGQAVDRFLRSVEREEKSA